MNIHDIYCGDVKVVIKKEYTTDKIHFTFKNIRRGFLVRTNSCYSSDPTFVDIVTDTKVYSNLNYVKVGDEYIDCEKNFITLCEWLGISEYTTEYNNVSKKVILKLIQNKFNEKSMVKEDNKFIDFKDYKSKIMEDDKKRNKLLGKALKRLYKKRQGDK